MGYPVAYRAGARGFSPSMPSGFQNSASRWMAPNSAGLPAAANDALPTAANDNLGRLARKGAGSALARSGLLRVLGRALPYVGWGLLAWELYDLWKQNLPVAAMGQVQIPNGYQFNRDCSGGTHGRDIQGHTRACSNGVSVHHPYGWTYGQSIHVGGFDRVKPGTNEFYYQSTTWNEWVYTGPAAPAHQRYYGKSIAGLPMSDAIFGVGPGTSFKSPPMPFWGLYPEANPIGQPAPDPKPIPRNALPYLPAHGVGLGVTPGHAQGYFAPAPSTEAAPQEVPAEYIQIGPGVSVEVPQTLPQPGQQPGPGQSFPPETVHTPDGGYAWAYVAGQGYARPEHVRARPDRNTRERKAIVSPGTANLMRKIYDFTTEAADFLDAAYKAVDNTDYTRIRYGKHLKKYKMLPRDAGLHEKAQFVWEHHNDIRLEKFIENLLNNNLEDTYIGWTGRAQAKGARNVYDSGLGNPSRTYTVSRWNSWF